MRRWAILLGLIGVLALGGTAFAGTSAPRTRACGSMTGARTVRATGLSCALARSAVTTYVGSPLGCRSGRACVQSGEGAGDAVIIDDCSHLALRVDCTVYVKDRAGPVRDPRILGTVVKARFDRGTVTFTLSHA